MNKLLTKEDRYIRRRLRQAKKQARLFYRNRKYPINPKKIVFTTIEGTTGFSCNPKYIALELLRRRGDLDIVWLVDDMTKEFPVGIRKVKNTLKNRAYELSTAAVWVDNSRKQLEVRKRAGQLYLQTWHANLGFKPIGFYRGSGFSRIARLVSQHDSNLIDCVLSNSDWFDKLIPKGLLYSGSLLRSGSPRLDVLVNRSCNDRLKVRLRFNLPKDSKIIMYAPTFRGGSQSTDRKLEKESHAPDYDRLRYALNKRFGGNWHIFLRLHPQLTARHIESLSKGENLTDVSKTDDMYELLAGCDAFITDYSSAAFDVSVLRIPVFIYADDYEDYEKERGKLLWNLRELPFPFAKNNEELEKNVINFDETKYFKGLDKLTNEAGVLEDGFAAKRAADWIEERLK